MDSKPPNSKVQVVVIGDPSTGKSSLIVSAMMEAFPEEVPSVLLPTSLPMDTFPDGIPITIIDTSSDPEHLNDTFRTCQTADVIVLTYSYNMPSTLERLTSYWLPELRRHNISVPVIVTGCKLDLSNREDEEDFEQEMLPLMEQFIEVKTCLKCSALEQSEVFQVFYQAQHSVLYPIAPLYNEEDQTLRPRLVSALKRIFILCDRDRDGVLNDEEINDYQIEYFGTHLMPREISRIKKVVQDKMAEGCNDDGLTLTGFLFLQAMMIEKGRIENVWLLLRKRGYDNNIMLQDDDDDDDKHELTDEVVKFLSECFYKFVGDKDRSLSTDELENLFSTAPGKPVWFHDSEETISLDRFISVWALMLLLDPVITFAYLEYLSYAEDLKSAFRDQHSERSCFQCFVFGLEKAGKSALLNWLIGKSFSEEYTPTTTGGFATNMIEIQEEGIKKTLIMREVPEETVESLWSKKNSVAACDVAIFVYDSCDEDSWKKAMDLLLQFSDHCENSGYQVPCFILSAKEDLIDSSNVIKVCQNVTMGVKIPILSVSAKLRNDSNLFSRIIYVAQHPHMFVPETEDGIKRKQRDRLLVFGSVAVATIALVGLASLPSCQPVKSPGIPNILRLQFIEPTIFCINSKPTTSHFTCA